MRVLRSTRAVLILIMLTPSVSGGADFACPSSIRVKQAATSSTDEWTMIGSEADHQLRAAGFSNGPPQEQVFLKPVSAKKSGDVRTLAWAFGPDGANHVWLSCSYRDTLVEFARQIPDGMKSCNVAYEERPHRHPIVTRIACQ